VETVYVGLGIASVIVFLLSLLLLPVFVRKIPSNYFVREHQDDPWHLLLQPRNILRNTLGILLIIAGIAMLVLPGQGLLTMLIGIAVMNFPGKYELERWLVGRKGVLRALNWIRRKAKVADLIDPHAQESKA
jgi:amino acid transporter